MKRFDLKLILLFKKDKDNTTFPEGKYKFDQLPYHSVNAGIDWVKVKAFV